MRLPEITRQEHYAALAGKSWDHLEFRESDDGVTWSEWKPLRESDFHETPKSIVCQSRYWNGRGYMLSPILINVRVIET